MTTVLLPVQDMFLSHPLEVDWQSFILFKSRKGFSVPRTEPLLPSCAFDRSSVGLIAPVGEDFASDEVACSSLQALHVDTQGVKALSGFKTPRLEISYEGESMVWKVYHLLADYQYVDIIVITHNAMTTCSLQCGSAANLCAVQHWQPSAGWDKWAELQQCDLPLPASYSTAAALHALVEEGGAAESRMARKFKADHPAVLLSVEPILFDLPKVHSAVEGLQGLTSLADVVSPDYGAACAIAGVQPATAGMRTLFMYILHVHLACSVLCVY
jgi:hypothetical protein